MGLISKTPMPREELFVISLVREENPFCLQLKLWRREVFSQGTYEKSYNHDHLSYLR